MGTHYAFCKYNASRSSMGRGPVMLANPRVLSLLQVLTARGRFRRVHGRGVDRHHPHGGPPGPRASGTVFPDPPGPRLLAHRTALRHHTGESSSFLRRVLTSRPNEGTGAGNWLLGTESQKREIFLVKRVCLSQPIGLWNEKCCSIMKFSYLCHNILTWMCLDMLVTRICMFVFRR